MYVGGVPEFLYDQQEIPPAEFWRYEGSRWKYVIAHEIGHSVQKTQGASITSKDYPHYEGMKEPRLCACDHVTVANQLHCLQSLEDISAVQNEGFAHFFAAKLMNVDEAASSCTFNYYKEFLDYDCRPGAPSCRDFPLDVGRVGKVSGVPFPVDCSPTTAPVTWRDRYCEDPETAQGGVEYDWLLFFWSLHRGDAPRFNMTDIFQSYRAACGGMCDNDDLTYQKLLSGVQTTFGGSSSELATFQIKAATFGVTTSAP
jgi:hypothetical protein